MSEQINVLLNTLTSDLKPLEFKQTDKGSDENKKEDKDGKSYISYHLTSGKWVEAGKLESLTVNNDVALATGLAEKGFTYRFKKEGLSEAQSNLIGLIRFKNACLRRIISIDKACEQMVNMSKNYTLNFESDTIEQVENLTERALFNGLTAIKNRGEGMKRTRKAGEVKPVKQFSL